MHIHEIAFEVVNREGLVLNDDEEVVEPIQLDGEITPPEPWETGFKDTVIAYPGQVTRLKARFTTTGPVRVALPHRRARGQRDDAPVPHRAGAARPACIAGCRGRDGNAYLLSRPTRLAMRWMRMTASRR
jgi:hypothetical protein